MSPASKRNHFVFNNGDNMQANQNQHESTASALSDILSQADFQKKHSDKFSPGQITWFLRNRDRNGLSKSGAVILSARKFYINEPLFTAWFASQNG
jgi:hypothetical protein